MGFFSMEHTGFKTWLVANQKIWGLVPVGICWLVALGLAILFGKNDDPTASMAAYLLTGAFLVSIAFTAAETNEKPNLIYTIIALAPIVFYGSCTDGQIFTHSDYNRSDNMDNSLNLDRIVLWFYNTEILISKLFRNRIKDIQATVKYRYLVIRADIRI